MRLQSIAAAALVLTSLWASGVASQSENAPGSRPRAKTPALPLERLVPADVLAFASAPRAEALVTALKTKSPFAALTADREVAAFLAPLMDGLAGLEKDAGQFLGVGPLATIDNLQGPCSIAVTGPDGEGPQPLPSVVVALSFKNSLPVQFGLRRIAQLLPMGYDVTVADEKVAGQTVTVFEWGERLAIYGSLVGNVLYVANAASAMEDVLLNLRRGGSPNCLADAPAFQRAALRVEAKRAHHFVYANLDAIRRRTDEVFARGFPEYQLVMKALDLRRVHTIAMSVEVGPRGFRERAYVGGKETAIAKLLRPGLAGSGRVGPSAVGYAGLRMNWLAWYRWIKTTLDESANTLESAAARQAYRYLRLGEEGALGIDFENDLVALLGDEVTLRVNLPVGGLVPQVLALVEVRDPERLKESFAKMKGAIAEDSGVKLRVSKYRSREIYRLETKQPVTPVFAILGKDLIVSINAAVVKRWIRRQESGLNESEAFRTSLDRVGVSDLSGALSALFLDTRRVMAFAYENLAPFLADTPPVTFALGMRQVRLEFDVDSMPSTTALTRHFEPLTVVTRLVEDGVRVDAFSPAPYAGVAYALFEGMWFTGMTGLVPAGGTAAGATAASPPPRAGAAAEAEPRRIPGELGVLVDDEYSADGCRIARVLDGTAAKVGGLKDGDVISRIDGVALADGDAAFAELKKKSAGQKVRLDIVRGGKTLTIEITLRPKP